MASITLLLGGARSGKSRHAEEMARSLGGDRVLFVATAQVLDEEMAARIRRHRASRPPAWHTLEAPLGVGQALAELPDTFPVTVVDCLTLLVSNVVGQFPEPREDRVRAAVMAEIRALVAALQARSGQAILISNEVGMGLVPPYPLGRVYRDLLGEANQEVARVADRVYLLVAGIPMRVKGDPG